MDDNQFIVEMVSNLAWPIVVVASVFLLKDKLKNLFSGGIKSAKYGDKELHFFDGKQAISDVNVAPQNLQHLIPNDPTGYREQVEMRLKAQLEQVKTDNEKIDVLVKNLAHQQLNSAFENAYRYIYGSQIRLLEYVAVKGDSISPLENLLPYYESFKGSTPELGNKTSMAEYLNFLVQAGLIKCNSPDEWSITKQGAAFVTYLTVNQLDKEKPH
jgi:hypothetical protein